MKTINLKSALNFARLNPEYFKKQYQYLSRYETMDKRYYWL